MLINCVAYQDGKKLADVPVDQIHLFVNEPGCFVWVALKDPEAAELEAMQAEFGLHDLAVEDAHRAISGRKSKSTVSRFSSCCT